MRLRCLSRTSSFLAVAITLGFAGVFFAFQGTVQAQTSVGGGMTCYDVNTGQKVSCTRPAPSRPRPPATSYPNTSNNDSARIEAERRAREAREAEVRRLEQQRAAAAEAERQRIEREKQEKFERDKREALGDLKGMTPDDGGLKGVGNDEGGLKGLEPDAAELKGLRDAPNDKAGDNVVDKNTKTFGAKGDPNNDTGISRTKLAYVKGRDLNTPRKQLCAAAAIAGELDFSSGGPAEVSGKAEEVLRALQGVTEGVAFKTNTGCLRNLPARSVQRMLPGLKAELKVVIDRAQKLRDIDQTPRQDSASKAEKADPSPAPQSKKIAETPAEKRPARSADDARIADAYKQQQANEQEKAKGIAAAVEEQNKTKAAEEARIKEIYEKYLASSKASLQKMQALANSGKP